MSGTSGDTTTNQGDGSSDPSRDTPTNINQVEQTSGISYRNLKEELDSVFRQQLNDSQQQQFLNKAEDLLKEQKVAQPLDGKSPDFLHHGEINPIQFVQNGIIILFELDDYRQQKLLEFAKNLLNKQENPPNSEDQDWIK